MIPRLGVVMLKLVLPAMPQTLGVTGLLVLQQMGGLIMLME